MIAVEYVKNLYCEVAMKRIFYSLVISVLFASSTVYAKEGAHWGYESQNGPSHWGQMSPDYYLCGKGKNQSPVNLSNFVDAKLPQLNIDYNTRGKEIVNNGHTIQVNYENGSTITIDNHRFALLQFHFHSPSENRINGKSYPLEGHFVHADKDGNLAVISVLYEEGKSNPALGRIWQQMPERAGEKKTLAGNVVALDIMPKTNDYYFFNGSLTTPPCTEGVRWYVLKQPVSISKQQIKKFTKVIHHPNNRPVQPLDSRLVLQ